MEFRNIRHQGSLVPRLVFPVACLMLALTAAYAQPATPLKPITVQAITQPPPTPLSWDATMKELKPLPGQATADFVFSVTNVTSSDVVVARLQPSCGCTTAKLPSDPWILAPGTNGQISVSVNLAGKFGTLTKTVSVLSTNNQILSILTVKVVLPENPAMVRARNQQIALADQQAVFRGDCAKCHVDKSVGKMGKELYQEACGICHEAKPRATMVTDLHNLNHPTDYDYWKTIVSEGKPRTLMPAFSKVHGGPLTDEQIDSLAKTLTVAFPSKPATGAAAPVQIKTSALATPPANN